MNIYVGNLSYQTREADLEDLFSPFGEVSSARVVTDRETGRSRGFGFVEMASDEAGNQAIQELDGSDFMGRHLKINEARPRPESGGRRPPREDSRY